MVTEVVGVESTETTFKFNNCMPQITDLDYCGISPPTFTITLGPWAGKVLPDGAEETGTFDIFVTDSDDPSLSTMNCKMSRTVAQICTITQSWTGTLEDPTMTPSGASELEDLRTFTHYPVTITAGLELLSSTHTQFDKSDATTSSSTASEKGNTVSASTPTATSEDSGAATCLVRTLVVVSVAGLVSVAMI
ncbi:hypothetical protein FSARC_5494 [Fusarium sarcochroum]|uniref:Uncharacterized protein n=1 Tax=Fusarium sarcochroum TaxID=1208366 RepID=A0A8H4TZC4_9HYPO|nr:hypothetical protein FSARC_5494 [Fusarium sarcochroum]